PAQHAAARVEQPPDCLAAFGAAAGFDLLNRADGFTPGGENVGLQVTRRAQITQHRAGEAARRIARGGDAVAVGEVLDTLAVIINDLRRDLRALVIDDRVDSAPLRLVSL